MQAVHIDTSEFVAWAKAYEMLPREMSTKVIMRTLNQVGAKAREVQMHTASIVSSIPFGDIKGSQKTTYAKPGHHAVEIMAFGEHLGLRDFAPYQGASGVTARVWGEMKTYRGSFIVRSIGGHVFKRKSKARLPIAKLYGPAVPKEMVKEDALAAFTQTVEKHLPSTFDKQMRWGLRQVAKAAGVKRIK